MAVSKEELSDIAKHVTNSHRPEVVALVSLRNVVLASTMHDKDLQSSCLVTLYLAANARLTELGLSLADFDRCSDTMHKAAITLGMLQQMD